MRLPARIPHESRGAIHERRLGGPGASLEGVGHGLRTADLRGCAHLHGCGVGSEHDLGVEHGEQRGEVTAARGSEEGVDQLSLAGDVGAASGSRSLHAAACAARELPCRGRGAAHDRGDLVEAQVEHVVQHERDPLGRRQCFEYHEQREADRVGQERVVLGIAPGVAARERLGRVRAPLQRLFGPRRARAQHVEAQPCDDGRKPSPEVLDSARVSAAEPQPGFLNGVVRLAPRAEHPVGDRPQVTPVLFESLRQPFVFDHRSHASDPTGKRTPRVRLGGRSAHEAIARAAKDAVTITCHAASPDTACDTAAPVRLKKMPA